VKEDTKSGKPGGRRLPGNIEPAIQHRIGVQLRDMYDHILHEPVPERFHDLLRQLENQEPAKTSEG
jgi:hypothetical protein